MKRMFRSNRRVFGRNGLRNFNKFKYDNTTEFNTSMSIKRSRSEDQLDAISSVGSVLDEQDQFEIIVPTKEKQRLSNNIKKYNNETDTIGSKWTKRNGNNSFWMSNFRPGNCRGGGGGLRDDDDDDKDGDNATSVSSLTTDRKQRLRMIKEGLYEVAASLGSDSSSWCCVKNPCLDDSTNTAYDNTLVRTEQSPQSVGSKGNAALGTAAADGAIGAVGSINIRNGTAGDQKTTTSSKSTKETFRVHVSEEMQQRFVRSIERRKEVLAQYEMEQERKLMKSNNDANNNAAKNNDLCSRLLCATKDDRNDDQYNQKIDADPRNALSLSSSSFDTTSRRMNSSSINNNSIYQKRLTISSSRGDGGGSTVKTLIHKRSNSVYSASNKSLFDTLSEDDGDESMDGGGGNTGGGTFFSNVFGFTSKQKKRQKQLHNDDSKITRKLYNDPQQTELIEALKNSGISLTKSKNKTFNKSNKNISNRPKFFTSPSFRRPLLHVFPSGTTATANSNTNKTVSVLYDISDENIDTSKNKYDSNKSKNVTSFTSKVVMVDSEMQPKGSGSNFGICAVTLPPSSSQQNHQQLNKLVIITPTTPTPTSNTKNNTNKNTTSLRSTTTINEVVYDDDRNDTENSHNIIELVTIPPPGTLRRKVQVIL